MIQIAAAKIRIASITPDKFSIFPCPYWCSASGGLSLLLTAKRAIRAAIKSIPECIASEITLTELIVNPTANLRAIRKELEITDNLAAATFFKADTPCFNIQKGPHQGS
jgi:hypothetical protein